MPNINCLVYGNKNKEKILLLHGWGQDNKSMYPLIDELRNKYCCVLLDLPGFGKSSFNNSENLQEYTKNIRDYLKEKNLLPSYIIGHSFGGKVAVQYYLDYKELKRLVIIASPLLKPTRTLKYYYKLIKYKLKKKLNKDTKNEGSIDYLNCKDEIKKFFISVVNTHYNKQIKNIEIPTILIYGNKDKQVKLNKGKKLKKLLSNSKLVIQNGTHFSYLENIQYTRLLIQDFLRSN